MTPEQVHYGMDKQIHQLRSQVLADAFQRWNFRAGLKVKMPVPKVAANPVAAWIKQMALLMNSSHNLLTVPRCLYIIRCDIIFI